jgi:FkbM family methyltransferase
VRRSLAGCDLVVRDGSLNDERDYDDAWLFACARHASVVFDVGANVGQSALLVLLCPNVRELVLVEANPDALRVAAENLIRNQLCARARFVSAFAADTSNAMVDLWTVGTGAAGSMYMGHAVAAARAGKVQRVPTTTLDELVDRYGTVPELVKVDVEGAESKVLAGSRQLAAHRRTRFLVEMHSPRELPMKDNADLVLAWATSTGYRVWYLRDGSVLETSAKIEHRGRCHVLLQPVEWEYPAWLAGIEQSAELPAQRTR